MSRLTDKVWFWRRTRAAPTAPKRSGFAQTPGPVRGQWIAYGTYEGDSFAQILTSPAADPFHDWRDDLSYASQVENNLRNALALRLIGNDLGNEFLRRAIDIAQRVRHAGPLSSRFSQREIMRLERSQAYAQWLNGGSLDRGMLETAYRAALADSGVKAHDDESDAQDADVANTFMRHGMLLAAARMALVGLDADQAIAALRECKRARDVQRDMTQSLASVAQAMTAADAERPEVKDSLLKLAGRFRSPVPDIDRRAFSGDPRLTGFELFVILLRRFGPVADRDDPSAVFKLWLSEGSAADAMGS